MGGLGGSLGLTAIWDGRPFRPPASAGTAKASRELTGNPATHPDAGERVRTRREERRIDRMPGAPQRHPAVGNQP